MTSKSLFNFRFIKENIKKNKNYLILVFILVPLLSTLGLMYVVDYSKIVSSTILLVPMFLFGFIPILFSYLLNGFVYKKKSVDFTLSLPISRKQIFCSNSLLGLGLILLLVLLNIFALYIGTLFIPGAILPIQIAINYIIYAFIAYSFIYIVSNLSMGLVGNFLSSIMVSLIIIFVVPFLFNFVNYFTYRSAFIKLDDNKVTEIGKSNENFFRLENKKKSGYYRFTNEVYNTSTTNIVYNDTLGFFFNLGREDYNLFSTGNCIFTIFLSIIYLILSYYVFIRKKMEISEVSFESYHVHSVTKCIILLPFALLFYTLIFHHEISYPLLILLIFIIGIYYIIDLVTGIGVRKFKTSILYLILLFIVALPLNLIQHYNTHNDILLETKDIDRVLIDTDEFRINTKDKDIINLLIDDNYIRSIDNENDGYEEFNVRYKVNNKILGVGQPLKDETKKKILEIVDKKKLDEDLMLMDIKDVVGVNVNKLYFKSNSIDNIKGYIRIENNYRKNLIESESTLGTNMHIYLYDKKTHDIKKYRVLSDEFTNYLVNKNNSRAKEIVSKLNKDNIYNISYGGDSEIEYTIGDVHYNNFDKVLDYINNKDIQKFDCTKENMFIQVFYYSDDSSNITLYLNDYDDFYNLLKDLGNYEH